MQYKMHHCVASFLKIAEFNDHLMPIFMHEIKNQYSQWVRLGEGRLKSVVKNIDSIMQYKTCTNSADVRTQLVRISDLLIAEFIV